MNHFSLEMLARQNQQKLLSEQLHEQSVRGYKRNKRFSTKAKLLVLVIASLIMYFWLFV